MFIHLGRINSIPKGFTIFFIVIEKIDFKNNKFIFFGGINQFTKSTQKSIFLYFVIIMN